MVYASTVTYHNIVLLMLYRYYWVFQDATNSHNAIL